ncbi:MAG: GtrA family protein [Lachnospiraceae bacterium]|nr:GtrA family protein [Lachnospiraceae bacterium]MDD3615923.1 GtrA family protein [Lachnospiraceae bacterium]
MKKIRLRKQLLRHMIVGGVAFLVDYGIMVLLTELMGWNYLTSSGFSFAVSVLVNYALSTQFVFDINENNSRRRNFTVFVGLSCVGLGLNQLLMTVMVEHWLMFYMAAKIVATGIVTVYNFVSRKLFLEHDVRLWIENWKVKIDERKKSWV